MPRGHYAIVLTAKKTAESTGDAVPQQHRYMKTWKRKKARKKSNSLLLFRIKKRASQLWKRHRVRGFPLPNSERY